MKVIRLNIWATGREIFYSEREQPYNISNPSPIEHQKIWSLKSTEYWLRVELHLNAINKTTKRAKESPRHSCGGCLTHVSLSIKAPELLLLDLVPLCKQLLYLLTKAVAFWALACVVAVVRQSGLLCRVYNTLFLIGCLLAISISTCALASWFDSQSTNSSWKDHG